MPSIINSGIVNVVYLHPNPKTNPFDLRSDAIVLQDRHWQEVNKVLYKPFEGLDPARYFELFHSDSTGRKKNTYSQKSKLEREVVDENTKEKGLIDISVLLLNQIKLFSKPTLAIPISKNE